MAHPKRTPDLFDQTPRAPLAERMRPRTLDEVVGQQVWLGPEGFVRKALQSDRLPSLLLWGPPGVGKTTLARVVARHSQARFAALSAVLDGVQQLRDLVAEAQAAGRRGEKTVCFVDEIHRWGRAQQDALLPHVESGTLSLIGATTENPGHSLTAALLSRCVLIVLEPLGPPEIEMVLRRAIEDPRGYGGTGLSVEPEALQRLVAQADGDARRALTILEAAAEPLLEQCQRDPHLTPIVDVDLLNRAPLRKGPRYDRQGDEHYQVVSAFIKSLRGSDPDAALYWLARMLEAGEDPRFICRRLVIFAAEDVANADPQALPLAIATSQAHELCGLPESRLAMAQATTYLACAPKSKASYLAFGLAQQAVERTGTLAVPDHLRNPSSSVGKALGWGEGYRDPHADGGFNNQGYLPDALRHAVFYAPTRNGHEARIAERLALWRQLRQAGPTPAK